jgi:hypothetical protein
VKEQDIAVIITLFLLLLIVLFTILLSLVLSSKSDTTQPVELQSPYTLPASSLDHIDNLLEIPYYEFDKEKGGECVICLELLENKVLQLPCGHCFHITCMARIKCNVKLGSCACVCPLCRRPITIKEEEEIVEVS